MKSWLLAPLIAYRSMAGRGLGFELVCFLVVFPGLFFLLGFLMADGSYLVKSGVGSFLGIWLLYSVSWIWNT